MSETESSNHSEESRLSKLWHIATLPIDDYLPFGPIAGIIKPGYRHILKSCELPEEIKLFIKTVVSKTRLWRYEKRDLTRELIAHFEDGINAEQDTATLIQSFGNVKITSNLIRRSKKRTRPLIWQAWRRSWQAVGIAFALLVFTYAFSAARMFLSSPSPTHDYFVDMNVIPAAIPESERAWPFYRTASIALNTDMDSLGTSLGVHPGNEEWPIVEAYVNRHQDSIAILRQAASISDLGYEMSLSFHEDDLPLFAPDISAEEYLSQSTDDPSLLIGALLPHLSPLRRASVMLETDAFVAAERGDGSTMVADLEAMIQTAEKPREIPFIINDLVAIAILDRTIHATQIMLHDYPTLFTDEALIRLAHRYAMFAGGGPIQIRLHGERFSFLDFIQHAYSDDGEGNGYLTLAGAELLDQIRSPLPSESQEAQVWRETFKTVSIPAIGMVTASRKDLVDMFSSLLDQTIAESHVPLWQRSKSIVEKRLAQLHESTIDSLRYWPVLVVMPGPISATSANAERITQMRDGLLVAIAIELHRRKTGSLPFSLEEISTAILPSIPRDRFDGGPIKYALRDGEPIIYSIGSDLDDDGGRTVEIDADKAIQFNITDRYKTYLASKWMPRDEVEAIKKGQADGTLPKDDLLADGDWILWPPQLDSP